MLTGTAPIAGSGLWVMPVAHEGNQNSSLEEVAAIDDFLERLLASGGRWTDRTGKVAALTGADVLIIAPYNAQVTLIAERLSARGVRVGTVDKFQGSRRRS